MAYHFTVIYRQQKMLQDADFLSGWCHHDSFSCQYEDTLKHLIQSSYPSSAISVNSISLKPTLLSRSFTHFRHLPITFIKSPSSFSPCVLVTQATTTKFSAAPRLPSHSEWLSAYITDPITHLLLLHMPSSPKCIDTSALSWSKQDLHNLPDYYRQSASEGHII